MALSILKYLCAIIIVLLLFHKYQRYQFQSKYNLPPRIPGIPIFGNTLQLPPLKQGLWGIEMARQYGEMFTCTIAGNTWVFLNSSRVVNDLMEKRSAIYSSRPRLPFGSEILSGDCRMVLMPYGERWRLLRRIAHNVLNKQNMPTFAPFQDVESRHLLVDFLRTPEVWYMHTQRFANSVIMSVVFGKRMQLDDPNIRDLFDTSQELIAALQPGAYLVDGFPWLARLPRWMQWWRKRGENLHRKTVNVYKTQVDDLRVRMEAGTARDCFAARFLEDPLTSDYGEVQSISPWGP